jgi:D-glucosaminate-6-phosphate ammonia-lyase
VKDTKNVYENLGARPIINAYAPMTRLGGGVMPLEVADAMREATQFCVDIAELQMAASKIIAQITGAEAGCVTAGAAASLLVGTAACVAGMDPAKMSRLPDARGMKNEVIAMRSQRNSYDHAIRATGVTMVEVGFCDRFTDVGVRDTEAWEIKAAITEQTAAIYYLAKPQAQLKLADVVAIAHEAGVPVLVDAAAELPPVENLQRFIAEGADLVAFSGGKSIGGPQGSGILCGRRDLISAALLQQLDFDYDYEDWDPPAGLVDKRNIPGVPRHGIGRSCKVGKEQIVGLLTALKLFVKEGNIGRHDRLLVVARQLTEELADVPGLSTRIILDPLQSGMPVVEVALDQKSLQLAASELVRRLRKGSPGIEVNPWRPEEGLLILSPACLAEGDPPLIGGRFKEILADHTAQASAGKSKPAREL